MYFAHARLENTPTWLCERNFDMPMHGDAYAQAAALPPPAHSAPQACEFAPMTQSHVPISPCRPLENVYEDQRYKTNVYADPRFDQAGENYSPRLLSDPTPESPRLMSNPTDYSSVCLDPGFRPKRPDYNVLFEAVVTDPIVPKINTDYLSPKYEPPKYEPPKYKLPKY